MALCLGEVKGAAGLHLEGSLDRIADRLARKQSLPHNHTYEAALVPRDACNAPDTTGPDRTIRPSMDSWSVLGVAVVGTQLRPGKSDD